MRLESSCLVLCLLFATVSCLHGATPPRSHMVPAAEVAVPSGFALYAVAPRTWVLHEAEPWATNVVVAEMPDGSLVMVNAPATEASTGQVLDYLRRRFGQRRLTVINAHHHLDSIGGNTLLIEAGAEVIGSDETAALIASHAIRQRDEVVASFSDKPAIAERFAETRIAPPSRRFAAASNPSLVLGGEEVRVIFPGAAHSPDNLVTFFPRRSVLFGGCMVRSGDSLGPLEQADLEQWPRAIAVLKALQPAVVVPGHGVRFDAGQLDHTLQLLQQR